MQQLDFATADTLAAAQGLWATLTALAVTYSFSVLGAILLIVVGYMIANFAERGIRGALKRLPGFDETLRRFFAKIIRYAILIVVGIAVLGQFGVQTASILAAIGAIGLAIGLALQGTLQNIAAGIMLLVLRPFKAGEYVEAGTVKGVVREIGLFATELRTIDGLYVLAPNSELWKEPVTNFNRNPQRRHDLTVGIGYDDDIAKAEAVMLNIAKEERRVVASPEPIAFVSALGDSAVSVTLRYWTATSDHLMTKFELQKKVKAGFDANGISIPFPQQEIRYVPSEPESQPRHTAATPPSGSTPAETAVQRD